MRALGASVLAALAVLPMAAADPALVIIEDVDYSFLLLPNAGVSVNLQPYYHHIAADIVWNGAERVSVDFMIEFREGLLVTQGVSWQRLDPGMNHIDTYWRDLVPHAEVCVTVKAWSPAGEATSCAPVSGVEAAGVSLVVSD